MAIELSNLTFTEQADIVPASGVEKIFNTGIANTLAGNDIIKGESGNNIPGAGVPTPNGGVVNTGTLNTDGGNDRLTGIYNDQTNNSFTGYGIYNVKGIIDTGDGNDILTGILDTPNQESQYGIYNENSIIDTGNGNDTIISINNITNVPSASFTYGIYNVSSTIDTGSGNDIILGNGESGIVNNLGTFNTGDGSDTITGIGSIFNAGTFNTGNGNDIITGTSKDYSGILNSSNSSIDTGDGNDIITAVGTGYIIYNVGTINTGNGNDFIIAEEANGSSLPLYSSANYGTINTGNGNDFISLQGGLYNTGGGMFLGEGNDSLTLTPPKDDIPNRALVNTSILDTGDGDDIITTNGFIDNRDVINTGNGKDSIIAERGFDGSGSLLLGDGQDYLRGFGSGNFNGGSGKDALELTSGSYTIGRSGDTVSFTKDSIIMNTSEFEHLIAGSAMHHFNTLTAGQIITVA
jgi:Ca2+-binding RTX toxin-like protein